MKPPNRLAAASIVLLAATTTVAQVVHDGTLGKAGPAGASGGVTLVDPSRGRQVGRNLFHSFQTFNVDAGGVRFDGPANVSNIISRVTGGQRSTIAGKLESTIAGANFYLINPAGVVFAPGASLDVKGSFTVTTADTLILKGGGLVDASTPSRSVLTSAPPSAFGFLSRKPAAIVVRGTPGDRLPLNPGLGNRLTLAGGDVNLNHADLRSENGGLRIEAQNRVRLHDALLITSQGGAGVSIDARSIHSTSSSIDSDRSGPVRITAAGAFNFSGGSIISAGGVRESLTIRAAVATVGTPAMDTAQEITVQHSVNGAGPRLLFDAGLTRVLGSEIATRAFGEGGVGGDIRIRGQRLIVRAPADNSGESFIRSQSSEFESTRAGRILIDVDHVRVVGPDAEVVTDALGEGPAGDVLVRAKTIVADGLDESFAGFRTAATGGDAGGKRGEIRLRADRIILRAAGGIDGFTSGIEPGGRIDVRAGHLLMDDRGGENFASIQSGTNDAAPAGPISIRAGRLVMLGHSFINASTSGAGPAGAVDIAAGSFYVDGRNSSLSPGIFSGTFSDSPFAVGATVSVKADSMRLLNGGLIRVSTVGVAPAGQIRVDAGRLVMGGVGPEFPTGLFSTSDLVIPGGGDAGTISVNARNLTLAVGGQISTAAAGSANAGSIDVRVAGRLLIRGTPSVFTGIESSTLSSGRGGRVTIDAGNIDLLDGGQVSVETTNAGPGGELTVRADELRISGVGTEGPSGLLSSSVSDNPAAGDAGNISIVAGRTFLSRGGQISSKTAGGGNAGTITLRGGSLSIRGAARDDGTSITAQSLPTATGRGGDVIVDVAGIILVDRAAITAESPTDGGNISMRSGAGTILLRSNLTARAGGDGGRINLTGPAVALNHSTIDGRSAGTPVLVEIPNSTALLLSLDSAILTDAPAFPPPNDIVGSLVPLDLPLLDRQARLFDLCFPSTLNQSTFRLAPPPIVPIPGGWLNSFQFRE